MGNQQSTTPYEPTKFSAKPLSAKPVIKSAMRRTSSVTDDASNLTHGSGDTTRYLPKGLGAGHSGLVMPTKPGDVSTTGYHSPEWGWYINTTPPTPEMYHSHHSSPSRQKKSLLDPSRRSTAASQPTSQSLAPQPAFTNAPPKATMGAWPGVPL